MELPTLNSEIHYLCNVLNSLLQPDSIVEIRYLGWFQYELQIYGKLLDYTIKDPDLMRLYLDRLLFNIMCQEKREENLTIEFAYTAKKLRKILMLDTNQVTDWELLDLM